MILTGSIIRKALVSALAPVIAPIPINSVQEPTDSGVYVEINTLSEFANDEKRAFITEGFINISVVEKFVGRGGDLDEVVRVQKLIADALTPDRLATFGNVDGINIFTMHIDDNSEQLFQSSPGRTAIATLRLRYMAQNI